MHRDNGGLFVCHHPSWLHLKPGLLHTLLRWLYLEVDSTQFGDAAAVLPSMADPLGPFWSPREAAMASMISCNGLAVCLWCDATTTLGMLG